MIDPAMLLILRLAFAILFAGAVVFKVTEAGRFRAVLDDYQLLPHGMVPAAFLLLVVVETSLAAAWLVGANLPLTAATTARWSEG